MSGDQRRHFIEQFQAHLEERKERLLEAIGGTSPLGRRPSDDAYGRPFVPGLRIRLIALDREMIDPLSFENEAGMLEGIDLGRRASLQSMG